jgi:hypothetical protein
MELKGMTRRQKIKLIEFDRIGQLRAASFGPGVRRASPRTQDSSRQPRAGMTDMESTGCSDQSGHHLTVSVSSDGSYG